MGGQPPVSSLDASLGLISISQIYFSVPCFIHFCIENKKGNSILLISNTKLREKSYLKETIQQSV